MNRDTEHIFYNQRMIIDNKVETEPRAWVVSKINRIQSNGVCMVTLAQDLFDQNRDYIEKDKDGNIIGMWCDWFAQNQFSVQPQEMINPTALPDFHITLSFAGVKPVIKTGGTFKKFTAKFFDKHENELEDKFVDEWKYYLDGKDIAELEDNPLVIVDFEEDHSLTKNQIKIKCKNSADEYLGKVLKIVATKDGVIVEQDIEIVGL